MFRKATRNSALLIAMLAALPVMSQAAEISADSVSVKVSTKGLDMSSASGVNALLSRLAVAAEGACGIEAKLDPLRSAQFSRCFRQTLGTAIRALNQPLLTNTYAERFAHDAARYSIEQAPAFAAK